MDGVAVGEEGGALLGSHLTESVYEDEHGWGLLVLYARVVAEDHEVPED